jgi:hypothetical protein
MSVSLTFQNLAVRGDDKAPHLPLTALDLEENSHVYGELIFKISGNKLPRMAFIFWETDDICFNT